MTVMKECRPLTSSSACRTTRSFSSRDDASCPRSIATRTRKARSFSDCTRSSAHRFRRSKSSRFFSQILGIRREIRFKAAVTEGRSGGASSFWANLMIPWMGISCSQRPSVSYNSSMLLKRSSGLVLRQFRTRNSKASLNAGLYFRGGVTPLRIRWTTPHSVRASGKGSFPVVIS